MSVSPADRAPPADAHFEVAEVEACVRRVLALTPAERKRRGRRARERYLQQLRFFREQMQLLRAELPLQQRQV
jgi:hypothetical protein